MQLRCTCWTPRTACNLKPVSCNQIMCCCSRPVSCKFGMARLRNVKELTVLRLIRQWPVPGGPVYALQEGVSITWVIACLLTPGF
jgi:hypothetical protein